MTYVITQRCCSDASCIPVCPVQCIRPRPGDPDFTTAEQLYIDPQTCIDCGACVPECPVEAIYADDEIEDGQEVYLDINADYFTDHPISPGDTDPLPVTRRRLPEGIGALRVAIVGSGPAACYSAELLSGIRGVSVTVIDRLPTPFGLVRAGVAADHGGTKGVATHFQRILGRRNVTCHFNVEVGTDVSVDEVAEHHDAVIWAVGAASDRPLGIEGEDLPGSHSAREFVAWANGHPGHASETFDLSGERAVIIGNGNVALDVARALTRPAEVFEQTDMAQHAVDALRTSQVREVVVVARRGAEAAAYSLTELMAIAQDPDVDLVAETDDLQGLPRPAQALVAREIDVVRAAADVEPSPERRTIRLRYGLTPSMITGTDRVEGVTFTRDTGETEHLDTHLVLRAIGYRGTPVPGLPFDDVQGVIPNESGRVVDTDGSPVTGAYCVGWIKRGPTGVIGSNRRDAEETVDALLADLSTRERGTLPDPEAFAALIAERVPDAVDLDGWKRIDAAERSSGATAGRPRLKLVTIEELLAASRPTG